MSGHEGCSKAQEIYYTFESAEAELMLFSSEAEALNLGNQVEAKRREFEELQHEQRVTMLRLENDHKKSIQLMELELAKQKQEKADRENELAKEISRLKKSEYALEKEATKREAKYAKEKAKRDARMNEDKDYYERRSYDRKDSSEVIKWLPAAVVGVGLLISKFL
jgi:septal ring factor EnvC (AmiA/AmiB activator)